ncbi:MAG: ketopantoate reductase family protein [Bacteroidetes bacterium]|nr:ketopantoate reductase family protein [Bacteroidota bacterium]
MKKFKILVFGIGGVGGYFGGKLAYAFAESDKIQVDFVARGEHAKAIRQNGLHLQTDEKSWKVYPNQVLTSTKSAGSYDLILLCSKTYDLEESAHAIQQNCTTETLILPLQNGVDNQLRLMNARLSGIVLEGLVYLIGWKKGPGEVVQSGQFRQLYFGSYNPAVSEKLRLLESIFQQADMEAFLDPKIRSRIWQKFMLVSPLACITSYTKLPIKESLKDAANKELYENCVGEVWQLACALHIPLPKNLLEDINEKVNQFKPEATTSMQRDFEAGKQTELESLCGFVVRRSKELGLQTPGMEKIYRHLQADPQ